MQYVCNEGQKDCVAVQSTVRSNESNLSYCTKICGAYTMTKTTNVEGLWGNGVWGVGGRQEACTITAVCLTQ